MPADSYLHTRRRETLKYQKYRTAGGGASKQAKASNIKCDQNILTVFQLRDDQHKNSFCSNYCEDVKIFGKLIGSFLSTAFVGNAFHSVKYLVTYARDACRYARSSFRMSAIGT